MNEELKQQALKFNDTQKNDFNHFVNAGFSPEEAILIIMGGQGKQTFLETAGSGVDKIIEGGKEIRTLTPRNLLKGTADIVRGGFEIVGGGLSGLDEVVASGTAGKAFGTMINPIVNTEVVQNIMKSFEDFNKSTDGVVGDVLTIASVLPISKGLKAISTSAKEAKLGFKIGNKALQGEVSSVGRVGTEIAPKYKTAPLASYLEKAKAKVGGIKDLTKEQLMTTGVGRSVVGIAENIGQRATNVATKGKGWLKKQGDLALLPEAEANLLRAGVKEGEISTFKLMLQNPTEKKVLIDLIENATKKVDDITKRVDSQREILGKEFIKPIEALVKQKEIVGKKLGEMRKTFSETKNINTNKAYKEFQDMLKTKYGAKIDKNKFIVDSTGASGSLEKATVDALQPQLQKLYSETFASQKMLDSWLRTTFQEFDMINAFDKVKAPDVATRIIRDTRGIYKKLMPKDYNLLLQDYAKISTPLGKINNTLKITQNIDDLTLKDLKAGEIARRLAGNASADLKEIMRDVLGIAEEYGYKNKIDLNRLAVIADDIEKLYDIKAGTSLMGQVEGALPIPPTSIIGTTAEAIKSILGSNYTKEEVGELLKAWIDTQ